MRRGAGAAPFNEGESWRKRGRPRGPGPEARQRPRAWGRPAGRRGPGGARTPSPGRGPAAAVTGRAFPMGCGSPPAAQHRLGPAAAPARPRAVRRAGPGEVTAACVPVRARACLHPRLSPRRSAGTRGRGLRAEEPLRVRVGAGGGDARGPPKQRWRRVTERERARRPAGTGALPRAQEPAAPGGRGEARGGAACGAGPGAGRGGGCAGRARSAQTPRSGTRARDLAPPPPPPPPRSWPGPAGPPPPGSPAPWAPGRAAGAARPAAGEGSAAAAGE